jgi:hypothetical protein
MPLFVRLRPSAPPTQASKLTVNARSNYNDIERNTAAGIYLDYDENDNTIMCVARALLACISCNRRGN